MLLPQPVQGLVMILVESTQSSDCRLKVIVFALGLASRAPADYSFQQNRIVANLPHAEVMVPVSNCTPKKMISQTKIGAKIYIYNAL